MKYLSELSEHLPLNLMASIDRITIKFSRTPRQIKTKTNIQRIKSSVSIVSIAPKILFTIGSLLEVFIALINALIFIKLVFFHYFSLCIVCSSLRLIIYFHFPNFIKFQCRLQLTLEKKPKTIHNYSETKICRKHVFAC